MNKIEKENKILRRKLEIIYDLAQYVDDRDSEPVFEIQLPCSWNIGEISDCLDEIIKEENS
jgi:hypothetical protein